MFPLTKKILLCIIFSFFQILASENVIWNYPLKKENTGAMENAFKPMTSNLVIRGTFKQTKNIPQLNKNFISNGNFVIAKNNGILWITEKPFANKLAISDSKMIQENESGVRSEMNMKKNIIFAQISKTIQSVFMGNTTKLLEEFKVFFQKNGKQWTIGLIPKEDAIQKAISSIELHGSDWLTTVKLIDGSKSTLIYELSNPKPADKLNIEEKVFFAK